MSPIVKTCIGTRDEPCDALIPVGQKRCPKHTLAERRRAYPKRAATRRDTPQRAVYNDKRWRPCRAQVLARAQGCCALCGQPANTADHWPMPLVALLAAGLDPYNPDTCRALCPTCSGKQDGKRSHQHTPPNHPEQTTPIIA